MSAEKKRRTGVMLGGLVLLLVTGRAAAAVADYCGNEAGFDAATFGLARSLVDFDDEWMGLHDVITNQYASRNVLFSTCAGKTIFAEGVSATPGPRSEPYYAQVEYESTLYTTFTLQFPVSVWGVSLYVRDINTGGSVRVSVRESGGSELAAFDCGRQGDYSYLAVLSDSKNIASVVFTANQLVDEQGFDDVVVVPEPSTLGLLVFGTLALLRGKRASERKR